MDNAGENKVVNQKHLAVLVSSLFFIASMLATSGGLWPSGLFPTHDPSHAARLAELGRALQDGHLPVRWSRNFSGGYGSLHFQFYAPLAYYVGAGLWLAGLPMATTVKMLMAIPSLVTWVGMYWLGWRLSKSWPVALLAAVAVTLAPYRAVDLYVRGALSELWGMMWLPWLVIGVQAAFERQRWAGPLLVIAASGLVLSHNLTALMAVPLLAAWVVAESVYSLFKKEKIWQSWLILVMSGLVTLGCVAWYLGPVVAEQHLVRLGDIAQGPFHYSKHFIYFRQLVIPLWGYGGSAPWPYNGQSNFLGYGQLMGVGGAVLAGLWFGFKNRRTQARQLLLLGTLLGILLLAVFLTNVRSTLVWQSVPGLEMLQFPWRWLALMVMLLGLIVTIGARFIPAGWARTIYCLLLAWLILFGNFGYFKPRMYLVDDNELYFYDPIKIRQKWGITLMEYTPRQVINVDPVYAVATSSSELQKIAVLEDKTQSRIIQTSATVSGQLELLIADFPGWQVKVDDQLVTHQTGSNGTILVDVPAGEHVVAANFTDTPIRWWSNRVSLVSWLVLAGWLAWSMKVLPASSPTATASTAGRATAGKARPT